MRYKSVSIKDYVKKIKSWSPAKEIPDGEFSYIDLSSVDKDLKSLIASQVKSISAEEAPSRARQLIQLNDVLISTVRPNLNGVAYLNQEFPNATASTGYCVLRVNDSLNYKFLYYWVRSKTFIYNMTKKATGASYPAVSDKIIKESKIPLPPLEQQKKIAAILDAADTYRQKTKALITKYDALTQSLFLDMFGDPSKNPHNWELNNCGEFIEYLADIGSNGANKTISKNLVMSDSEDYAIMIRTTNLSKNNFNSNLKFVSKEVYDFFKKSQIFGGEIIMNKIGSAGDFWIMPKLDKPVSLGLNQFVIRLKGINLLYFYYFLSTDYGYQNIKSRCNGVATKSITKTAVRELPILQPPIKLQNQFAERVKAIEAQKAQAQQSLAQADNLFNSLLQKAFKGALV